VPSNGIQNAEVHCRTSCTLSGQFVENEANRRHIQRERRTLCDKWDALKCAGVQTRSSCPRHLNAQSPKFSATAYSCFTRSSDRFTDWLVWRSINYIFLCAVYHGSGWRILKGYREPERDVLKAQWLLYLAPGCTLRNFTFCSHRVFIFCMDLRTNNDYFRIQN